MAPRTLEEQLVASLRDAHAIEQQALAQLKRAPRIAGDEALAQALREHEPETERHEQLVRERLRAHDATPSTLRDLAGTLSGAGFAIFAGAQPDTPGKLATHAFAYEHLELASYDLLARLAELADDHDTAVVARRIRGEEAAMADRLEVLFQRTATASLQTAATADDPAERLTGYLAHAHAIEVQAEAMLEQAVEIGGAPALERAYAEHLEQTRGHLAALERLLEERDATPSKVKDAALKLGALNWGGFFQAQSETPAKLAAFAYAFEHLEIGAYEHLRRVAQAAGDEHVATLAGRILGEEQRAAETVHASFDAAVRASLAAVGAAS